MKVNTFDSLITEPVDSGNEEKVFQTTVVLSPGCTLESGEFLTLQGPHHTPDLLHPSTVAGALTSVSIMLPRRYQYAAETENPWSASPMSVCIRSSWGGY